MGDLNYRTTNISLEDTMQLMKIKDLDSLRQYDEFLWDVSNQLAFLGFWEPPFSKDFYPTYKKKEKRPSEVDKSNSKWIDLVYRTQYKEPWYKSGKVQPRMPSYCDRILIHSIREAPTYLLPAVDGDILSQYRAIEDQLTGSDHSAVSCGFVLTIPYRNRIRWRNDWRKQPKILKVTIGNVSIVKNSTTSNPKSVRALFPMPYEAGNDFPVSEFFSKESFQAEKKPSLSWISPPHTHTLHLSLKIRTESDIHGECVIPLSLLEFKEGKTLQFTETLYQYGIPLCDSNEKVFANIELALSQSIATIPGAWEFLKEEKQAQNQSSPTSQLSSPKTFRSRFNRSRYMS